MIIAHVVNGPWVLGLSEENLKRLREGKPILKSLAQFGGPDVDLLIVYGVTEQAIKAELEKHCGPLPPPIKPRVDG